MCPHCEVEEDDADHTMRRCSAWEREREELIQTIGRNLELDIVILRMIRYECIWKAVETFAKKVMARKEEAEREKKAREAAEVLLEADEDDWSSDTEKGEERRGVG